MMRLYSVQWSRAWMEYPQAAGGTSCAAGILWGTMSLRSSLALALLGLLPLAAQGQQPVRAPGGTLTGVVQDSATGLRWGTRSWWSRAASSGCSRPSRASSR